MVDLSSSSVSIESTSASVAASPRASSSKNGCSSSSSSSSAHTNTPSAATEAVSTTTTASAEAGFSVADLLLQRPTTTNTDTEFPTTQTDDETSLSFRLPFTAVGAKPTRVIKKFCSTDPLEDVAVYIATVLSESLTPIDSCTGSGTTAGTTSGITTNNVRFELYFHPKNEASVLIKEKKDSGDDEPLSIQDAGASGAAMMVRILE